MRWWLLALIFVFSVAWARGCIESGDAFEQAVQAEKAGELAQAIEQYQYAARWYTPVSSVPGEAALALTRIGKDAEARGDRALALKAWRRLRGAVLATRGLTTPLEAHLELANTRLAELMAQQQLEDGGPTIRGRSKAQLIADHLALLRLDPAPHSGWSLLVVLSFIGWISTMVMAIWRGLDESVSIRAPALWRWGGSSVLFFVVWLLALSQA